MLEYCLHKSLYLIDRRSSFSFSKATSSSGLSPGREEASENNRPTRTQRMAWPLNPRAPEETDSRYNIRGHANRPADILCAHCIGGLTFALDEVHGVCRLVEYPKLWLAPSALWVFYTAVCVPKRRGRKVQIAQINQTDWSVHDHQSM